MRSGITGAFGVPVENDNGRRLCVRNTYFERKSSQGWQGVQDRVEVKSMIDLVLVKKDMLHYV